MYYLQDSKVKFHILGHKCQHCGSYNTSQEKIEGLPEISIPNENINNAPNPNNVDDVANPDDDDDDQWTTEEEEEVNEDEQEPDDEVEVNRDNNLQQNNDDSVDIESLSLD